MISHSFVDCQLLHDSNNTGISQTQVGGGNVNAIRQNTTLTVEPQSVFLDHPTSADVYKSSCGFHQPKLLFPNQFVSLRSQVHNHHNEVRLLQQVFHLLTVVGTNCLFFLLSSEGKIHPPQTDTTISNWL